MRLLCVEDEALLREDIAEYLRLQHHEVDEAACGEEALACMQKNHYDAVVCDIKMPRMNGFEVLQHVRSGSIEQQLTPFIFLTALTDQEDWVRGHEWGCDAYLTKPVNFVALDAAVQARVLRQRMAEHIFTAANATFRNHVTTALADTLLPPMAELNHLTDYLVRTQDQIPRERLSEYLQQFQESVLQQQHDVESMLTSFNPRKNWKESPRDQLTPEDILLHALTLAVDTKADLQILHEGNSPLLEVDGLSISRALAGLLKASTPLETTLPVLQWRATENGFAFFVSDHPHALEEDGIPFYPLDATTDLAQLTPTTRQRLLPLLYAATVAQEHGGHLEIKLWDGHWLAVGMVIEASEHD